MANYIKEGAEHIEEVAKEVIKKHHPKLANIKIGYQFIDKARNSKGRTIFAEANKVPGKYENFIEFDLIVTVAENIWAAVEDPHTQEAIIDDVFRTIELEEKELADEFPRRLADNYFLLSNGKRVKGQTEAEEAQREICDYDIKIYDYDVKVNVDNMREYGAWRKDLERIENSILQTRMNFPQVSGE